MSEGLSEPQGHFGAGAWRERAEAAEARVAELLDAEAQLRVIIAAAGPERLAAAEAECARLRDDVERANKRGDGWRTESQRLRVRLRAATELLRERRSEDFDFAGTWDDRTRAFLAAGDS